MDTAVSDLSWYFHLAEYEAELEFAEAAAPSWVLGDAGMEGWMRGTARGTRIRRRLSALPDHHSRVLAAAFQPRAYRHCWQRFSKHREVELAPVATRTVEIRSGYTDRQHTVVDAWFDEMGRSFSHDVKIDGIEAYVLSLGDGSKRVKQATDTARAMLEEALEAYGHVHG